MENWQDEVITHLDRIISLLRTNIKTHYGQSLVEDAKELKQDFLDRFPVEQRGTQTP